MLVVPLLSILAACAGGGGGGGGSTTATTGTITTTTQQPTPVGPSATSAEYLRNPGLALIRADAAYAQGASGKGVTIAVIDSGVDGSSSELSGRLSTASTDINPVRNTPVGTDQHGTWVAEVIASNFDNAGTVGVAFDSTILSIRADSTSPACGPSSCYFNSDLARSLDYAVQNGAKVINLSLGGAGLEGSDFEAALSRAVAAGVIIVAAGGNDGVAEDHYPSGYAIDPRYAGYIVGVGALNADGTAPASFSNLAGGYQNLYLFAPGQDIITGCVNGSCWKVSGTSFAAPHVAGAMALVLQAFPNLNGPQALDLLLRTAKDMGAPGTDAVYGRGALDLSRAFAPVGSLSVPTGSGAVSSGAAGSTLGEAFGDAVQVSGALKTVGWDMYQRPFATDLSRAYVSARPSLLHAEPAEGGHTAEVTIDTPSGGRLMLSAGAGDGLDDRVAQRIRWLPLSSRRDVALTYAKGRMALTAWSGQTGANPLTAAHPDPFAALANADHVARAEFGLGRWTLSAEGGAGEVRSPDLLYVERGSRYARASGSTRFGVVDTTITFGRLDEPMGPLGSYIPARTGLNLPSGTTYGAVSASMPLADGVVLSGQAGLGRTTLQGRFLELESAAWSTQWQLSLDTDCQALGLHCGGLRFSARQPLRIESGRFLARLPDMPSDYFGPVTFSERRFVASPSGREVDLTVSAFQKTAWRGRMQLEGVMAIDAGNRSGAAPGYGVMGSWRRGF